MAYLRHRAGLAMSMYPASTSTPSRYGHEQLGDAAVILVAPRGA